MLERFDRRRDLREHRGALRELGIAGTTIRDRFYWHPARWLAARWGDRLTIHWNEFDSAERLEALLPGSRSIARRRRSINSICGRARGSGR